MLAGELAEILQIAELESKYVWLKHQLDPRPRRDRYYLNDDGTINAYIYLSFLDAHQGLLALDPEQVEWAHVSSQVWPWTMCERIEKAKHSQTLIRLVFSDFLEPWLFRSQSVKEETVQNSRCAESVLYGNFVDGRDLKSDPNTSRIRLDVLLDVENTDIAIERAAPCLHFHENCGEPHLRFFGVNQKA